LEAALHRESQQDIRRLTGGMRPSSKHVGVTPGTEL
jgi:hypothetical protein